MMIYDTVFMLGLVSLVSSRSLLRSPQTEKAFIIRKRNGNVEILRDSPIERFGKRDSHFINNYKPDKKEIESFNE